MALFFRAIEQNDGLWACRRGTQEFDRHTELSSAVEHLRSMVSGDESGELFVHRLDGTIDRYGAI